jgi:hypothetical protein
MVSELFDADRWRLVDGFEELTDITYHRELDADTGADRGYLARDRRFTQRPVLE